MGQVFPDLTCKHDLCTVAVIAAGSAPAKPAGDRFSSWNTEI